MIVQPLTRAAMAYVAANMRAADAAEILATRWTDDPMEIVADAEKLGPLAWAVGLDGCPIACVGALEKWPGVWQVWMFATDDFDKIGLRLTRFVRRVIIPAVVAAGGHRAQAFSAESHTVAHKWLEVLGATREGPGSPGFGKNRETFYTYAWTRL